MLSSFALASIQLFHPSLRKYVVIGVLAAVLIMTILWLGVWLLLVSLNITDLPIIGWLINLTGPLFDWAARILIISTLVPVTFFLYPGIVIVIISLLLEQVANAVEAHHFPDLPPPKTQRTSEIMLQALKFSAIIIAFNLLSIPIYMFLFFLSPLNLVYFYIFSGYLIGREYFELVAFRRLNGKTVKELLRNNRYPIFIVGLILTASMTIPIVNLFSPIFCTALMTHIFHQIIEKNNLILREL